MSRRGTTGSHTYRPAQLREVSAPWQAFTPSKRLFSPIIVRPHSGPHCFSVCLYHEPEFNRTFPARDYKARYLDSMPAVRARLAEIGYGLNIFCDASMLETALSFGVGSVYLVIDPPAFAFQQHKWRYYSALLPEDGSTLAYHFRGMDNLLVSDQELSLFDRFLSTGSEIKHAPYEPLKKDVGRYIPVRGSCSVAGSAIQSLGWWMETKKQPAPTTKTSGWHNDEVHLAGWFNACHLDHKLFTIVDRDLPMAFYRDLSQQLESGMPMQLIRL